MIELYQITLSYACAGIVVKDNKVIDVAPIFIWMKGKNMNQVKNWIYSKRGSIKLC